MTVRSARAVSMARWTSRSLIASSAEVPSSKIRIGAFLRNTRANAMRCFWPPERFCPRSATRGRIATRHRQDFLVNTGHFRRATDLRFTGPEAAVGDVLCDRAREDKRVLADVAYKLADRLPRNEREWYSTQDRAACARVREPQDRSQPGCLAAARPACHSDRLSVPDADRHVVQDGPQPPSIISQGHAEPFALKCWLANNKPRLQ